MPSKPSNTSAVDSQVRISDTELFAGAESWLQRVTAGGEVR